MPPWLPDRSVSIWMHHSSRAFSWRWTEPGQAPQRCKTVQALLRPCLPQLQVVSSHSLLLLRGQGHTHQWGVQSCSIYQDQTCISKVGYSEFCNQLFHSCLRSHAWPRQTASTLLDLPTARDNGGRLSDGISTYMLHYTMLSTSLCKM